MKPDCDGVVLCGGRGLRLGGVDKPLQIWRGRPLIETLVGRVAPQVSLLFISANRHHRSYQTYGRVLPDLRSDYPGPLAGIEAALAQTAAALLFVCPGDCPTLPGDLAASLRAPLQPEDDAVVVHDGIRRQPLHLLLRTRVAPRLSAYLDSGQRSVHGWLDSLVLRTLYLETPERFRSLNTPADFGES